MGTFRIVCWSAPHYSPVDPGEAAAALGGVAGVAGGEPLDEMSSGRCCRDFKAAKGACASNTGRFQTDRSGQRKWLQTWRQEIQRRNDMVYHVFKYGDHTTMSRLKMRLWRKRAQNEDKTVWATQGNTERRWDMVTADQYYLVASQSWCALLCILDSDQEIGGQTAKTVGFALEGEC